MLWICAQSVAIASFKISQIWCKLGCWRNSKSKEQKSSICLYTGEFKFKRLLCEDVWRIAVTKHNYFCIIWWADTLCVLAVISLPTPKRVPASKHQRCLPRYFLSFCGKTPSRHGEWATRLGFLRILQCHHCREKQVVTTWALKHRYIFCITISESLIHHSCRT